MCCLYYLQKICIPDLSLLHRFVHMPNGPGPVRPYKIPFNLNDVCGLRSPDRSLTVGHFTLRIAELSEHSLSTDALHWAPLSLRNSSLTATCQQVAKFPSHAAHLSYVSFEFGPAYKNRDRNSRFEQVRWNQPDHRNRCPDRGNL